MATKKKIAKSKKPALPALKEPTKAPSLPGGALEGASLRSALREIFAAHNEKAGHKIMAFAEDVPNTYEWRRPSGIMQLDIDTGGGLPAGGLSYLSGPDNCLDATSFIHYEVKDSKGKRINHKGGSIEKLFERFHGLAKDRRHRAKDAVYFAPSVNDGGGIVQNKILDVVYTDVQECYEVITKKGQKLNCTNMHKFLTDNGYLPLSSLVVGSVVFTHTNITKKAPKRENYFRFTIVSDTIKSITAVGLRKTYDLKMASPFHNYVANNIVVHNSGKSYLIMLYMLMHQKLYGHKSAVAYACVEGGFDFRRAMHMGLKIPVPDQNLDEWDRERVLRGDPPYTEQERDFFKQRVGEIALIRGNTGEEVLQGVLEAIKTKVFGIIALDSVSIIEPEVDASKDMDENNKMASHATLLTNFIRKYTPTTCGLDGLNYTTLIFSAQVRANAAKAEAQPHVRKYLKDWATGGAFSARHGKLVDVTIWDGSKITKDIKTVKTVVGKTLHWEITKGKAGTHDNITGEVPFYYDNYYLKGVNLCESVVIAGMRAGIIVEHNKTIQILRPETGQPGPIPGASSIKDLINKMENDFELELAVRTEVLAARGIHCLYR